MNFPKLIPIFPLSNFIMFPKTTVPLNIFEPRYIDMINDSMKSEKFIGMIQPKSFQDKKNIIPDLYKIGCLGKITSFKETESGTFLIELKGLTPGMLVTLGEKKILSLQDFADLASDELTGGFDVLKGERVKIQGYLEDFALSKEEADNLIMTARNIVYKD